MNFANCILVLAYIYVTNTIVNICCLRKISTVKTSVTYEYCLHNELYIAHTKSVLLLTNKFKLQVYVIGVARHQRVRFAYIMKYMLLIPNLSYCLLIS